MANYAPTFQPGQSTNPVTQVELTISCKNLRDRDVFSKSDPMCVVFMKDFANGQFREVGRTEQVKNSLNPEFDRHILLDYRFEESQRLKFELYDVDSSNAALSQHDFLGRTELTLGELMSSPGSKIHKQLIGDSALIRAGSNAKFGSIIISAEETANSREVVYLQMKGVKLDKKDFLGKSDPFLQIYRKNDDGSTQLVYRSEVISNNLNPVWKPFRKLTSRQLCHGDHNRLIRIECFDYDNDGGHDLIGICEVSLKQLAQTGAFFDLINAKKQSKKKGYKNSGQLQVMQCLIQEEHSFLDFIRGGTQIHFTVAVDFTASNGNPTQPSSLHFVHAYEPNQYMIALKAVGEICQDYDHDKFIPALGFGAKIPPNGEVSHEFFLNFHPADPRCHGISGVLDAYRRAILSVQLFGPTNFANVIHHVSRIAAAQRDGSHYFVLLIITDGVISDFEQTKAAIVAASSLPMSIIIVGVGNADFQAMEALDADKVRLSAGGRFAERDIVQFVPFRDYLTGNNYLQCQGRLAQDVLAEIPEQLTSYMRKCGVKPKPPAKVNVADQAPLPSEAHCDTVQAPPPTQPVQPPQQGYYSGVPAQQPPPQFANQQMPPQTGPPPPYQPGPGAPLAQPQAYYPPPSAGGAAPQWQPPQGAQVYGPPSGSYGYGYGSPPQQAQGYPASAYQVSPQPYPPTFGASPGYPQQQQPYPMR